MTRGASVTWPTTCGCVTFASPARKPPALRASWQPQRTRTSETGAALARSALAILLRAFIDACRITSRRAVHARGPGATPFVAPFRAAAANPASTPPPAQTLRLELALDVLCRAHYDRSDAAAVDPRARGVPVHREAPALDRAP